MNVRFIEDSPFQLRAINQFGHEFCLFRYIPEHQLSLIQWMGFVEDNNIKEAYLHIGLFCRKYLYQVVRSVTDLTAIDGSFDNTNEWLLQEIMPKMVKYGYRYSAIVRPQEFFAVLATEEQDAMVNGLYINRMFDDSQSAYDWVVQQQ